MINLLAFAVIVLTWNLQPDANVWEVERYRDGSVRIIRVTTNSYKETNTMSKTIRYRVRAVGPTGKKSVWTKAVRISKKQVCYDN